MTEIRSLSKTQIENLATQALTAREKGRIASQNARRQKQERGLVQVSVWMPKSSPEIAQIKDFAKKICDKHAKSE